MSRPQTPEQDAVQRLEEFIARQGFALRKLEREGAYACEIRSARRQLRSFEARLAAVRGRACTLQ